jgi:hypothetical protein
LDNVGDSDGYSSIISSQTYRFYPL